MASFCSLLFHFSACWHISKHLTVWRRLFLLFSLIQVMPHSTLLPWHWAQLNSAQADALTGISLPPSRRPPSLRCLRLGGSIIIGLFRSLRLSGLFDKQQMVLIAPIFRTQPEYVIFNSLQFPLQKFHHGTPSVSLSLIRLNRLMYLAAGYIVFKEQ